MGLVADVHRDQQRRQRPRPAGPSRARRRSPAAGPGCGRSAPPPGAWRPWSRRPTSTSSSSSCVEVAQRRRAHRVQRAHHGHAVGHHLLGLLGGRALRARPSSRVALPDTAAASGTVASTRIWPALSASFRLVRFSDWARNGTERNTIGPARGRLGVLEPLDVARRAPARAPCAAASSARPASREPITTGVPARREPQRQAEPERAGAADDRDGVHGRASTDSLPPAMRLEGRIALVTGGAGGIGAATCRAARGRGRARGRDRPRPRGRARAGRRDRRRRLRARRALHRVDRPARVERDSGRSTCS